MLSIDDEKDSLRIWEIDVARGCAVLLMIVYHTGYDLSRFSDVPVNINARIWYLVGKAAAFLFIFLSGLSSTLSHNPVRRGIQVLLCGVLITVVTYVAIGQDYVRFGILHFLGIAMLISPAFQRWPARMLVILAIFSVAIGSIVTKLTVNNPWLLPVGIRYPGLTTVDYYPFFPYLAIFLLGIIIGRHYFAGGRSRWPGQRYRFPLLGIIGRHSLPIYLLHQPVLISLIGILKVWG